MKTHGILPSLLSACFLCSVSDALETIRMMASSSSKSAFVRSHRISLAPETSSFVSKRRSSLVMYDDSNSKSSSDTSRTDIVWTTLTNTERWIQKTLGMTSDSSSQSSLNKPGSSNPYSRKEVAYVCETSDLLEEIVAGVFRRLREMREIGAGHGQAEQELRRSQGAGYRPHTFRQTLVVVAPSCEVLTTSFDVFDNLIVTINEARRSARDYVTEIDSDWTQDWVTSVNLAHLHPQFNTYVKEGSTTNNFEDSATSKSSSSKRDVDPATKEYMERRTVARRSPYPSMVIEVKSTPPFFNNESPKVEPQSGATNPDSDQSVSSADVKKLEALFGMKAVFNTDDDTDMEQSKKKSAEDELWDALANSNEIEQLTFLAPADIAQIWVIENDLLYDAGSSYFTSFDSMHVDAAYEFIFATIAMQRNRAAAAVAGGDITLKRDYLIFPNFLSKAATSFEKFSGEVQKIINAIPGISEVLCVSTFHPEHVDKAKRSPAAILVLESVHML